PERPAITFISYFEFLYGIRKKDIRNKEKAISFIEEFSIIQTTKTTAGILVWLKEKYELPLADLLIASQAIENQSVLITKDNDFDKIRELNKIII
ncbi:MAG: PIN domain-containing protein, partial [Candidatus Aenigmarchaeota archaeon]|nr:PIN domain-containing protein [Candidatus Aenigmarchaeota archaeon]